MNTNHDRAALSKAGVSPKRARYTIECQTNELGDGISNNLHTTRVSDETKKKHSKNF